MKKSASPNTLARKVIWLVVIAVVISLSWLKAAENHRDRDAQEAWRQRFDALQVESSAEGERLTDWLRSFDGAHDARQQIESELTGGEPLPVVRRDGYDFATWRHPNYGIQVELTFYESRLVASGLSYGTAQLQQVHPQPPQPYREGKAESIRKTLPRLAIAVWVVATLVAVASARFGWIAAEGMLAMALVCGAAWLVSPWHTVTLRGVFSNDILFVALLMNLSSVVVLALRVPLQQARVRFHLRALLLMTAVVAVLMALGPVGYVALGAFLLGASLFVGVLKLRSMTNPAHLC